MTRRDICLPKNTEVAKNQALARATAAQLYYYGRRLQQQGTQD